MIIVVEEALTNTILQSNYRSNKVVKITNYKEFLGFINGGTNKEKNKIISNLLKRMVCKNEGTIKILEVINNNKLRKSEIISNDKETILKILE